jgi:hypothetical protein
MASSLWVGPKPGIPVIRIPCWTTQNSCAGLHSPASSSSSGGAGFSPFAISLGSRPGAPWHAAHISS